MKPKYLYLYFMLALEHSCIGCLFELIDGCDFQIIIEILPLDVDYNTTWNAAELLDK